MPPKKRKENPGVALNSSSWRAAAADGVSRSAEILSGRLSGVKHTVPDEIKGKMTCATSPTPEVHWWGFETWLSRWRRRRRKKEEEDQITMFKLTMASLEVDVQKRALMDTTNLYSTIEGGGCARSA